NVIVGNVQLQIEAAGKQFFNTKNLSTGRRLYRKAVTGLIQDFGKLDGTTLFTQLVELYDPMQGELTDNYSRKISGSMAKKLFSNDSLFLLQQWGEHSMIVSSMYALMDATPVKTTHGKTIPLHEPYEMGANGRIKLKDNVIWSPKQQQDFIDRLHGI